MHRIVGDFLAVEEIEQYTPTKQNNGHGHNKKGQNDEAGAGAKALVLLQRRFLPAAMYLHWLMVMFQI